MQMIRPKEIYAEWLRVFAAFSVVFQHTVTSAWYGVPVDSENFFFLNFLNSLSRFGVGVFVMISGAFMLSPKYPHPPQKIFRHNLPKIFLLTVFWVIFYGIIDASDNGISLSELLSTPLLIFTRPHTHLWFLYVIAGLYVLTPPLRVFTQHASQKMLLYAIALFVAFGLFLPTLNHLLTVCLHFPLYKNLTIHGLSSFVGYYLAGFYLSQYGLPKVGRKILYAAAIIFWAVTFFASTYVSNLQDAPNEYFFGNFRPTTFLVSASVFCLAREKFRDRSTSNPHFLRLSQAMLGVYLIHPIFIRAFYRLDFSLVAWNPLLSAPTAAVLFFALSTAIVLCIRQIPFVKKIF